MSSESDRGDNIDQAEKTERKAYFPRKRPARGYYAKEFITVEDDYGEEELGMATNNQTENAVGTPVAEISALMRSQMEAQQRTMELKEKEIQLKMEELRLREADRERV